LIFWEKFRKKCGKKISTHMVHTIIWYTNTPVVHNGYQKRHKWYTMCTNYFITYWLSMYYLVVWFLEVPLLKTH